MPRSHENRPRTRCARDGRLQPVKIRLPATAPHGLRMLALLALAFFIMDGVVRVAGSLWKPAHYHVQAASTAPQIRLPGPVAAPTVTPALVAKATAALPMDASPLVATSVQSQVQGRLSTHALPHRHGDRHDREPGHVHGRDRRAPAPEPPAQAHPPGPGGTGVGHHRHPTGESGVVYLELEHPHSPLAPSRVADVSGSDGWVPALYARRPWTAMDQVHAWRREQMSLPLSWHVLPEGRPPWSTRLA